MAIKAIVVACLAFHAIQFSVWNSSLFLYSEKVNLHERVSSEQEVDNHFDVAIFEDRCNTTSSNQSLTACENCGCSTQAIKLILPLSTECDVTEKILQEIFDLIYAAYLKATTPPDPRKTKLFQEDEDFCQNLTTICNTKSQPTFSLFQTTKFANPACNELIDKIKETIQLISIEIEALLEYIVSDPSGLLIKIAQLQNCVNCLRNDLADAIEKAANETAKCYEDGLGKIYTCFTTELGKRTEKILDLERQVSKKRYDLIASNVLAARYTEAALEFRDMNNQSLFDSLMETLYASRQLEHILQFGYQLHHNNISGRVLVYDRLNKLMNNSMPDDVLRVVFRNFLNWDRFEFCGSQNYCFDQGLPLEFAAIMVNVIPKTDESIRNWATMVRNGNFESLIKLGSPEIVNMTGRAFHDVIDELVTQAYDKTEKNLKNVANFVMALRWNNQSYTGFSALIREAGSVGVSDQLHIALLMKKRMESLTGPDGEAAVVRKKFDQLRNSLRKNIQNVVWGKECTLQAWDVNKQYLYAENNPGFEAGNRRVAGRPLNERYAKWTIEKVEVSQNSYEFRLKNEQFSSEYLGPHIPWKYESWDRGGFEILCTTTPNHIEPERKHYNWEIRFGSLSADDQIELFHIGRQAYLHAEQNDWVYLNMFGKTSGKTRWKIDCTF